MNTTLQNGFRLIEHLAESGQDCSVKELSALAGLPPSTVCRLLKTLIATGYLEQQLETRKYRISLKLLTLSQTRLRRLDLRRIGHSFAAQLGKTLRAPVFLSAPCRGQSIIVDVVWPYDSPDDPGLVVGQIHSIRHSACGKVCAAFAQPDDQEHLHALIVADDPAAPPDAAWREELLRIRAEGLAVRKEEGVLAVAAPLFRAGCLFAGAIGAMLPPATMTSEIEQAVRRSAHGLSFALGQPFQD